MSESFRRTVTSEMMEMFLSISGDFNPLHCSEEFAQKKGHAGRVVYGMLTASLYSTLAGVYLPGEHCLLMSVDSKFLHPVFVGDEMTVTGKVTEIHEELGFIVLKASIVRTSDSVKVSRATIQAAIK